jgi:hypothetical protein
LLLLFPVLPELILDEAREFLLFADLNLSVEGLNATLRLDLLHMEVKDVLVSHLVAAHVDPLAELARVMGGVNEGQPGGFACRGGRMKGMVTCFSHSVELLFALLGVRVREMYIADGMHGMVEACDGRACQGRSPH